MDLESLDKRLSKVEELVMGLPSMINEAMDRAVKRAVDQVGGRRNSDKGSIDGDNFKVLMWALGIIVPLAGGLIAMPLYFMGTAIDSQKVNLYREIENVKAVMESHVELSGHPNMMERNTKVIERLNILEDRFKFFEQQSYFTNIQKGGVDPRQDQQIASLNEKVACLPKTAGGQ